MPINLNKRNQSIKISFLRLVDHQTPRQHLHSSRSITDWVDILNSKRIHQPQSSLLTTEKEIEPEKEEEGSNPTVTSGVHARGDDAYLMKAEKVWQ